MAIKSCWIKMINSMVLNYKILENFLCTGKYELLMDFSKSSIKIVNTLIKKQLEIQKNGEIFLTGNMIILKSGIGLIFLKGFVFRIQDLNFNIKKNLITILEKYLTTLNILILNNYFKIIFMFIK